MLARLFGRRRPSDFGLAGAAYVPSVPETARAFERGARIVGPEGVDHNSMEHPLGTDSRNPSAKHRILEMYSSRPIPVRSVPACVSARLLRTWTPVDPAKSDTMQLFTKVT